MKFFLLCFGYTIALFIFQAGFLLKRKELHMKSSCRDARVGRSACWMAPQYNRVILMIIDALRYDFIAPPPPNGKEMPYIGQMRFTSQLAATSLLTSVLADPPTTTLQRLKAMTTGTLPTFIDASDNFSPDAEIHEDNLLDQLLARRKNITLMGDDTWISLYPGRFHRQHPFPSFDVHDLHTVDDGVLALLPDELDRNDSQLVIAHFLGVDHCGHRYGPNHPEMANKLRQMDRAVEMVANRMRDDDLLIVVGDHGMTSSGDHGGDAEAEVTAGLLIHSRTQNFASPSQTASSLRQIDLVPTLALLLGIPIPFSNLGTVISQLFTNVSLRTSAVQLNYEQVIRFARTYAASNPILLDGVKLESDEVMDEGEQLATLLRVQSSLRAAWTQFDTSLMLVGLISMVECLLYNLSDEPCTLTQWIIRSGVILLQLSTYFGGGENPAVSLLFFVLPLLMIAHCVRILKVFASEGLRWKKIVCLIFSILPSLCFFSNSFIVREASVLRYLLQSVVVVSLALHVKGWEKKLGGGRLSVKSLRSLIFTEDVLLPLLVIALLRLEPFFHRCREEEEAECQQYFPTALPASLSVDARAWRLALGMASAAALCWLLLKPRRIWRAAAVDLSPESNSSASLRISRALLPPALLFAFVNWVLDMLPSTSENVKAAQLGTAWLVYGLSALIAAMNFGSSRSSGSSFNERFNILLSTVPVLLMLLGNGMSPALCAYSLITVLLPRVVDKEFQPASDSILLAYGFYYLGHSPTLTAIPWTAAFVGVPGSLGLRIVPAVLVLTHLYASTLLVALRLGIETSTLSKLVAATATRAFCSALAAAILRRHLMVWKIFAPRFIFEAVGFLYFIASLAVCSLIRKRFGKTK